MIKGRTPNIQREHILVVAKKMFSPRTNQYGNRPISKRQLNEIIEKAPGTYTRKLIGGKKTFTPHETKKIFGELGELGQEHPDVKISTFARKLGVRLHQGDNRIENFNAEHFGEKGVSFIAKVQQEADASKDTGPTPEELKRQERRKQANLIIGRSQRLREEAGGKKPSPFAQAPVGPTDTSGRQAGATTSATSHAGAGTLAGASQVAGQSRQPTMPIPGQAKPSASAPVQLAGLGGLGRLSSTPSRSVPAIGVPDTRPTTPPTTEASTPSADGPDDSKGSNEEAQLPDTTKVDEGLPLGE